MIDSALPVGGGQRSALRVADRHQWHLGILTVDRAKVRDIEPPVEGDDGRGRSKARQRQSKIVGVAMDDVKLLRPLIDLTEHTQVVSEGDGGTILIEP